MIRLHLQAIALFTLVFLGVNVIVGALGRTQPPDLTVRAFIDGCEDKPQPCWLGVVPGQTTLAEIEQLMAFAGEPELTRSIFSQDFTLIFNLSSPWSYCRAAFFIVRGVVLRGELRLCRQPDIRVGDLTLLMVDAPKMLSLPPNELVYGGVSINAEGWPKPYSRVNYIALLPPEAHFPHFPWLGFVSQRRYCDLVENFPRCD